MLFVFCDSPNWDLEVLRKQEFLQNHLEKFSVFCGTSNRIQNDLISADATIILKRIKQEIGAVILDETTDITNFSQLAMVMRYVKADESVEGDF